jgi:hypothetical protein
MEGARPIVVRERTGTHKRPGRTFLELNHNILGEFLISQDCVQEIARMCLLFAFWLCVLESCYFC